MGLRESYFGLREFHNKNQIVKFAANSKNFNIDGKESIENADALLILSFDELKTWLVVTNRRIYRIVDNLRAKKPRIAWSVALRRIDLNRKLAKTIPINKFTGQVRYSFWDKRNYKYTQELFLDLSLEEKLNALITRSLSDLNV